MRGLVLALFSGFLAACASVCGKISMTTDEPLVLCENVLDFLYPEDLIEYLWSFDSSYYSQRTGVKMSKTEILRQNCLSIKVLTFVRVVFFLLMVGCNAVMWVTFTKALAVCHTTISATLTNTAANFFCSAVFGVVFFGERPGYLWWLGTGLIVAGLLLMNLKNPKDLSPPRSVAHRRTYRPKTS